MVQWIRTKVTVGGQIMMTKSPRYGYSFQPMSTGGFWAVDSIDLDPKYPTHQDPKLIEVIDLPGFNISRPLVGQVVYRTDFKTCIYNNDSFSRRTSPYSRQKSGQSQEGSKRLP